MGGKNGFFEPPNRELGNIEGANFTNVNLSGADLSETHFVRCSFVGANLENVNATDSTFIDCDFTNVEMNSVLGIWLTPAQLKSTRNDEHKSFRNADITIQGEGELDFTAFYLINCCIESRNDNQWVKTSFANAIIKDSHLRISYE